MATQPIKVYQPACEVKVHKVLKRTGPDRLTKAPSVFDLTPYLMAGGTVTTRRAIGAPAGEFGIVLAPMMDPSTQDYLCYAVEPMDYIEIKMAREPHLYPGGMPVVMRGFVTSVKRSESMQNGKPKRSVTIQGHDWLGKALQVCQISYLAAYAARGDILSQFGGWEAYDVNWLPKTAADFVRDTVDKIIGTWLGKLEARSASGLKLKAHVDATVTDGTIAATMPLPMDANNLLSVLHQHADLEWNELFTEERDDGSYLVYRPKPYLDMDGKLILGDVGAVMPEIIDIDDVAVVEMSLERDDHGVANLYNVRPIYADVYSQFATNPMAYVQGTNQDFDHINNDPRVYGERVMARQTAQLEVGSRIPHSVPVADRLEFNAKTATFLERKRDQLIALQRDNGVWENGNWTLMGSERLRPGVYLRTTRGALRSLHYVRDVTQTFNPFSGYSSRVATVRGNGFVERLKLGASPFLAEGNRGAYG